MKKQYVNPTMYVVNVKMESQLLAGSGGVTTDSALGEKFSDSDVSYGRDADFDDWDD